MAVCFLQATKANSWSIDTLSPKQIQVRTTIAAPQKQVVLPNQFIEETPILFTRKTEAVFYKTTENYDRVTIHFPLSRTTKVVKYSVYYNKSLALEENPLLHDGKQHEFELSLGQISANTEIKVCIYTHGLVDRGQFGSANIVLTISLDHAKINPSVTEFSLSSEYTGSATITKVSHGWARIMPQGNFLQALAEKWELRWQKEYVLDFMPLL